MKPIDTRLLHSLTREAEASPRRRTHHLLHESHQDPVQRMLMAIQPGSYFRPHRHTTPPKWELMLVLQGAAAWLGFDARGRVSDRTEAGVQMEARGLEWPPGVWHALVCMAPDTVLFTCRPGPFAAIAPEDFAPWAPEEGAPDAVDYVRWMARARPGERFRRPDDGRIACS
jgi:cupin fold WbuC family metalloprotein